MEWISVEDRLPEYETVVIVYAPTDYPEHLESVDLAWFVPGNVWESNDHWEDDDGFNLQVTHWMPLPDPPQDAPESS